MVKLIENHTKQSEVITLNYQGCNKPFELEFKPMSAIFLDESVEVFLVENSVLSVTLTDTEGMF